MHRVMPLRRSMHLPSGRLLLAAALLILGHGPARAQTAGPLFTIAVRAPQKVVGTPASVPVAVTVTDVRRSRRTITLTQELQDAGGRVVWSTKPRRLGFTKERALGVAVTLDLPALPPGPYMLISSIPDSVPLRGPTPPQTPDEPAAPVPEAPESRPVITVHTPILIEDNPWKTGEAFTVTVAAPDLLPRGPVTLCATVTVSLTSPQATAPILVAELADDRDRVFCRAERPVAVTPTAPAVIPLTLTAPELPAGQYVLNARLRDAAGQPLGPPLPPLATVLLTRAKGPTPGDAPLPVSAIRHPLARLERFNYDRDLLWATWAGKDLTPGEAEGMRTAGINTGTRYDYRFPYRWFVDHAPLKSPGVWAEEALRNRKESGLAGYAQWLDWVRCDPGFAVMDMYDELGWSQSDNPDKERATQLMYWRNRDQPGVATISRFNALMETDCLGWDEVLRPGFPEAGGTNAIRLKWAFKSGTTELINLRMGIVRELNPNVQLTPGMGAGLRDGIYDSMHNRAYNKYTTVNILGLFTAGLPFYGTEPWGWLISLKPPFEQHSRITWASLAAAGRFFPIYCPGDGYGDRIASATGQLTASGTNLMAVHDRIQPNAPILLATRNRVIRDVLYLDPGWSPLENGLFEGLLACGVQPDCGTNTAGRKLIVVQRTTADRLVANLRPAAEAGAVVMMTTVAPEAALGAFGLTPLPADASATNVLPLDVALTGLKDAFPGLAGVRVRTAPGSGATLTSDSPLKAIHDGTKTVAWVGAVGKGLVLCLDGALPLNRPASGALMRAVLERAGVVPPFRFSDDSGACHAGVLASWVETTDHSQGYLIVVAETNVVRSRLYLADPAIQAVRDCCARKTLDWQQDAEGRYVTVDLPGGVGTLLALLKEPSDGRLQVTADSAVAGGELLQIGVTRLAADGSPTRAAHTFRARVLGPEGKDLPALTRWATSPGPVLLAAPVALNDPAGTWTIEVEDLTDGLRASATITKADPPGSPPTPRPVRKTPGETPPPLSVTFEPQPELTGDVMLVTARGRVHTSLADCPDVTVELDCPAADLLTGAPRATVRPTVNAPAPFSFALGLSRGRAQSLRGGRNQGIAVTLTASGLAPVRSAWTVPVSPYARAPHHVGSETGGVITLRVDNATDRERPVALGFDECPGWARGPGRQDRRIAAGASATYTWPIRWDDPTQLDPGYCWRPVTAVVDGVARPAGSVFLEQDLEQRWRIGLRPVETVDGTDPWNPDAALALTDAEAEAKGWPTVTLGTVLDWDALITARKPATGLRLVAITRVRAPSARQVRIGYAGPVAPSGIWLNGEALASKWERPAKTGGFLPQTVELKAGLNTLAVEAPAAPKTDAATALKLLDPITGKTDRSLRIGL